MSSGNSRSWEVRPSDHRVGERPKIYGPFWPYNRRGLPIVLKNGIPAWMVAEPRTPPASKGEQ